MARRGHRKLRKGLIWDNFIGSNRSKKILFCKQTTILHSLTVTKVRLFKVSKRLEGSPIVVNFPILLLPYRAHHDIYNNTIKEH